MLGGSTYDQVSIFFLMSVVGEYRDGVLCFGKKEREGGKLTNERRERRQKGIAIRIGIGKYGGKRGRFLRLTPCPPGLLCLTLRPGFWSFCDSGNCCLLPGGFVIKSLSSMI